MGTYEKKQECHTTYREECKPDYHYGKKCGKIPEQKCSYKDVPKYHKVPEEKCHEKTIPKCHNVPQKHCNTYTVPKCHNVPTKALQHLHRTKMPQGTPTILHKGI